MVENGTHVMAMKTNEAWKRRKREKKKTDYHKTKQNWRQENSKSSSNEARYDWDQR